MSKDVRVILAAVAAFYVVVGGLFLSHYIPYQRVVSAAEEKVAANDYGNFDYDDPAVMNDLLNVSYNEAQVSFYGSILIWGSLAIATFGCVFIFTRRRRAA